MGHILTKNNYKNIIMLKYVYMVTNILLNLNSLWPNVIIWQHRYCPPLVQVIACYLMTPHHYLDQWCLFSIGPLEMKFSEILIKILQHSFKASNQASISRIKIRLLCIRIDGLLGVSQFQTMKLDVPYWLLETHLPLIGRFENYFQNDPIITKSTYWIIIDTKKGIWSICCKPINIRALMC